MLRGQPFGEYNGIPFDNQIKVCRQPAQQQVTDQATHQEERQLPRSGCFCHAPPLYVAYHTEGVSQPSAEVATL